MNSQSNRVDFAPFATSFTSREPGAELPPALARINEIEHQQLELSEELRSLRKALSPILRDLPPQPEQVRGANVGGGVIPSPLTIALNGIADRNRDLLSMIRLLHMEASEVAE